jgi:hypothetical protein
MLLPLEDMGNLVGGRIPAQWVEEGTEGAAAFDRPEDVEVVGDVLYVSITGESRVLSIDVSDPDAPTIGEFVPASMGLNWPDNIAKDQDGNLYIAEDVERLFGYIFGTQPFGPYNRVLIARQGATPLSEAASVEVVGTLVSHQDEPSGLLYDPFRDRLLVSVLGPNNHILAVPLSDG